VRDVQARDVDLPRPASSAEAAVQSGEADPVGVFGEGASCRQTGAGVHPTDPADLARGAVSRKGHLPGKLRHADWAAADAWCRRVAQQPAASVGGFGNERDEGAAQWWDELLDPGWLVARGLPAESDVWVGSWG